MRKESKQQENIVIAAGGTGGHLFPAQALAKSLQEKNSDRLIVFLGSGLISNRFFDKSLFPCREVSSSTFSRSNPIKVFYLLAKGVIQALRFLREFRPSLVIGFGSYHAFPVCLAARLCNIPLVLVESNTIAGKVNQLLSRFALFSAVQFSATKKNLKGKSFEVSMPVYKTTSTRQEALSYFSLCEGMHTILVFGGSQGAKFINEAVIKAFCLLPNRKDLQVIHLTGNEQAVEPFQALYQELGIAACVKPFESNMHLAWSLADVAICRAGAATFSELVFFEVPSILIPYPFAAEQHQQKNARLLQDKGAAFCLEESEFSPQKLSNLVENALKKETVEKMEQAFFLFKKDQVGTSLQDLLEREFFQTRKK